jgi:hypothetical protein
MSRDYFSIGYDSEFQFKKAVVQKFQPDTMLDDMMMPCDTCSKSASCEANATECTAFRTWTSFGKYAESDVQRLVRGVK